jgi:hypothetical protein
VGPSTSGRLSRCRLLSQRREDAVKREPKPTSQKEKKKKGEKKTPEAVA